MKFERLRKRIEKLEAQAQRVFALDLEPGSPAWWEHWGPIVGAILDGEPVQMTIEAFRVIGAIAEGRLPIPDVSAEPDSAGTANI